VTASCAPVAAEACASGFSIVLSVVIGAALPCTRCSTASVDRSFRCLDRLLSWMPLRPDHLLPGRRHDEGPRRSRRGPWVVRRPLRPAALSPPIPRLPPGAGNQADKLEGEDLELAKKGYLYVVGQSHSHAPAITTNGDSDVVALAVWLTHLSRNSLRCGDVKGLYTLIRDRVQHYTSSWPEGSRWSYRQRCPPRTPRALGVPSVTMPTLSLVPTFDPVPHPWPSAHARPRAP
jgi:hypothetical protein